MSVELEAVGVVHRGGVAIAQQRHRHRRRSCQGRQQAAVWRCIEMARDPARRRVLVAGCAAFHEVHRLEVAAGVIVETARMDDRQFAGVVQLLERSRLWVQAHPRRKRAVAGAKVQRGVGAAGRQRQLTARLDVGWIIERRDQAQAVASAAQKYHHQDFVCGARRRFGGKRNIADASARHCCNRRATTNHELSSCNVQCILRNALAQLKIG